MYIHYEAHKIIFYLGILVYKNLIKCAQHRNSGLNSTSFMLEYD